MSGPGASTGPHGRESLERREAEDLGLHPQGRRHQNDRSSAIARVGFVAAGKVHRDLGLARPVKQTMLAMLTASAKTHRPVNPAVGVAIDPIIIGMTSIGMGSGSGPSRRRSMARRESPHRR